MDLVRAVVNLQAFHQPSQKLHILFVGSGALGAELRHACEVVFDAEGTSTRTEPTNAPRPRASFAGFLNQTEISRAYVAADCLVLASDYGETWGLVVNEALASGLPCIVSDACGCAEDLCGDGVFPLGDISSLASRLLEAYNRKIKLVAPPTYQGTVDSVVRAYSEI